MHGPTSAAGDDLMTWHNLPCSPTLHAFAGACPHGWVELHLEQYRAVSYGRAWGVSSDDLEIIFEWLDWGDGIEDDEVLCLPAGAVVIAQVDNIPRCDACKSVGGGAIGKRCARDGCPGGVCGWGKHARPERVARVAELLAGRETYALEVNKDGSPKHPLYIPAATVPQRYTLRGAAAGAA